MGIEELRQPRTAAVSGRGWSWAALVAALMIWAAGIPTFGLSVILSPLSFLLTGVAWYRSPHDAVFWIGFALNTLLAIGLLGIVVAVLTGEAGIGVE